MGEDFTNKKYDDSNLAKFMKEKGYDIDDNWDGEKMFLFDEWYDEQLFKQIPPTHQKYSTESLIEFETRFRGTNVGFNDWIQWDGHQYNKWYENAGTPTPATPNYVTIKTK